MNWLLFALITALLAACQSQPAEVPTKPAPVPAPTPPPAAKRPARSSAALNWPVGYVDTVQAKEPRPLRLTPSSAAAFARLPAAAPDTSEANCLRKAETKVQRMGKTLTLPLCQGTQELVTYDQTDNPDSTISYSFAGTLPGARQWVVATTVWEGFYYLLIDRCSGRRHYAWNYPVPSPDKKYFVVANSDLEAQYTPTGMQLWAVTPSGIRKIWERAWPEDTESGPAEARWLDAHTLLIKQEFPADTKPPNYVALDLNRLVKP